MVRLPFLLALMLSLGGLGAISVAASQASAQAGRERAERGGEVPAPAGYDAAIDVALEAFERADFEAAREHFLRAHKIYPNARTLRALGKSEFELRSYADAAAHLELALGSQARPLTSEQQRETSELLERARQHLARYTFITEPRTAELTLDGVVPALDRQRAIVLSEGPYRLRVEAEGYLPLQRDLQVVGGVDERLSLELAPMAEDPPIAPLAPVEAPRRERRDSDARRSRPWLWTGLAVLAGGVAAATVGILVARRNAGADPPSGGSTGVVLELGN